MKMNNKDLITLYIDATASSCHTERSYTQILNSFSDYVGDVAGLSFTSWVDWKKSISNRSVSTQKLNQTVTKGFLTWCKTNYGIGNSDELDRIKEVKAPRGNSKPTQPLLPEQLRMMIEYAKNIRDKAIIALMASTGMRVSELINIRLGDFIDGNILIKGKGNKYRYVYPNKEALELVQEYINTMRAGKVAEKNLKTDLLFISNSGKQMRPNSLNNTWKNIVKKCGFDINVHNHTFRHTTGNAMISQGIPLDSVQHILGHADISTTQIYATKSVSQVHQEVANVVVF